MARELLMMQNNYEWVTAEGKTLEIENAIRSNARDLKIEGQTYQNLSNNIQYKGSGNWTNVYNISENGTYTFKSDNKGAYITLYDNDAIDLLKENSVYTLVFDVDTDFVNYKGICINGNGDGYFDQTTNIYLKDTNITLTNGSYKFKFTMGSVTNMLAIGFRNTNTITGGTYFRAYNFKLLEGDYTNTELPTSINGIESVAERETNVLQIAQSSYETDGIVLPNGVQNTIEMVDGVLNHIQRVGKYTANDTRFITAEEVIHKTSVTFKIYPKNAYSGLKPNNYNNTKSHPICSLFNYIPSEKTADELYVSESDDACFYTGGTDWLRVKLTKATYGKIISLTEFLEMKPIVYYELITPVYTPIEEVTNIDLPIPLRSLPNGVCDTIEGNKVIQRVGKYTITGTETYDLRSENDYMFVVQFDNILTETASDDYNNSNTKMICDKALCRDCSNSTFVSNSLIIGGRSTNSKGFIIAIPKSLLTEYTVAKAKEYIQSLGGITVYYELATPIEHTINVPRIPIAKGTNIITTTNNIAPNLSMKYKKLKNKR